MPENMSEERKKIIKALGAELVLTPPHLSIDGSVKKAMELAVWGMLPHNTIGRSALTRCRIFKGAEHTHSAQKPIVWDREIK